MKLLCDQMLGSLAKWLRIFGLDTFYANSEITDEELLKIAKKENRTVITRDKELTQKAKKQNTEVIQIKITDLEEQLNQVLNLIKIDKELILTRCTICNSLVKKINKSEVKGKVPKKVFENNDKFWFCKKCNKVYWTGSHYDKINEKIDKFTGNKKHN